MDAPSGGNTADLTWSNVGLAFSFILFDAVVSKTFGLGVGTSLVTAAVRCVIQLTLVALILQKVFDTNNPWGVAGIACECYLICIAQYPSDKFFAWDFAVFSSVELHGNVRNWCVWACSASYQCAFS